MLKASALVLGAALAGCAAPNVQLAAPVPAPQRIASSQIANPGSASAGATTSRTYWITVRDARPERPPRSVGLARTTMGIPRQIRQAGDWDLARAIGHGLGTGLQNAGWEATGFDPPDPRLADDPARDLPSPLPGWTIRLIVDQLWCDGYFNEYSLAIGLRLHLLDPGGRLKARAEHREELVREYKHPGDYAFQVEEKIRKVLSSLLLDLGLANLPLAPKRPLDLLKGDPVLKLLNKSRQGEDELVADEEPEPEAGRLCPSCKRPAEPGWKHCPNCGAALPAPR